MKFSTKVILTMFGISIVVLAHSQWLDKIGLQHTEDGLNRALITYAVSRSLNGVISVVQGTEVAIEPVGVGMTFTPGQILDPVNDLIERFSTIVLISGTAFGLQRVFLEITSTPGFSIVASLITLLAIGMLWSGRKSLQKYKSPIYKLAILLFIVRFSVTVMAIAGEKFYQVFLEPQFQSSSQLLLDTTDQLNQIQHATEASSIGNNSGDENSLLESARQLYRSATSSLDLRQHLEDFKQAAEQISEHTIRLIVVFVFQTIIVPLASIWLVLKALRWVATRWNPA